MAKHDRQSGRRRPSLLAWIRRRVRPRRSLIEEMRSPPGVADIEVEFPKSRDMPRAAEFND
jgi:hypothetical protein